MKRFSRLTENGTSFYITQKVSFEPIGSFKNATLEKVFEFSYNMTFGHIGEHRNHRSGGTHKRANGEIFVNTFQGKLSECALYNEFFRRGISTSYPDFEQYGLGEWDTTDLIVGEKTVSIKSTKGFGNLLLLETKDWNQNGQYIPNEKAYDYTFLIRMNPYCEELLRRERKLYSNTIEKDFLKQLILSTSWSYDIPGFITLDDLIEIIDKKFILPQNALLNGKTKMDAENYYIQSGDMRPLNEFISDAE